MVTTARSQDLNSKSTHAGPVVYWMIRDQRAEDNWALLAAQQLALSLQQPLHVVMIFRQDLHNYHGTERMFSFMNVGLSETAAQLQKENISFYGLIGDPVRELLSHCKKHAAGAVICDFFPLHHYTQWQSDFARQASCTVIRVDAHNCIPCWVTSPKQEYAARTIRPKIHPLLASYLTDFPALQRHPFGTASVDISWQNDPQKLVLDTTVAATAFIPGSTAGQTVLRNFIAHKLNQYPTNRNDPSLQGLSDLSPYLHFGQIAAQRVAYEVAHSDAAESAKKAYLEELIVRRELADNFCWYSGVRCMTVAGAPDWAQKTLATHARDQREYLYTLEQFEQAETHDPYWNAAQQELLQTGKMHGYMRMYWAKKILEWSRTAQAAVTTAIYLNDHYQLDGRDPNGYVGILWSIAGLHDRPWFERPIFGTVRYMAASGLKKKFAIDEYVKRWLRSV